LIKCIYGLEDLQDGTIYFKEKRVLGPAYQLIPGHEGMTLVSQDFYVLDNHTVEENIWDKLIGYTNEYKAQRSKKLLHLLELEALKNTKAKQLSSGQKQRVAIARALAIIPALLLLDEPFNNLAKLLKEKLFHFIQQEIKKKKTAVIMITHIPEEAIKYSDSIGIIDNGRLVQLGSTHQVFYKPKNLKVAGLLGDYTIIYSEDIQKKSEVFKLKTFLRPNQLQLAEKTSKNIIAVKVIQSFFNGKCFEIIAETKTEQTIHFYHSVFIPQNEEMYLTIFLQ
jgi:iron(III) transport system ATP-binding protein